MEWDWPVEHGVQVIADIGGTSIGKESVELRSLSERIDTGQGVEEELLGLIGCQSERMEIDLVPADVRAEIDDVFFVGDNIEEAVLSEDAQPE